MLTIHTCNAEASEPFSPTLCEVMVKAANIGGGAFSHHYKSMAAVLRRMPTVLVSEQLGVAHFRVRRDLGPPCVDGKDSTGMLSCKLTMLPDPE